jgi:hypothetical protein
VRDFNYPIKFKNGLSQSVKIKHASLCSPTLRAPKLEHPHIHVITRTQACTCTHTLAPTPHARTHTLTLTRIRTHAHPPTHETNTSSHPLANARTHTHRRTHSYTHPHTHARTQSRTQSHIHTHLHAHRHSFRFIVSGVIGYYTCRRYGIFRLLMYRAGARAVRDNNYPKKLERPYRNQPSSTTQVCAAPL